MPVAVAIPTTARALLDRVREYGPAVEGDDLVFDAEPPAELVPVLAVLHTGGRALLSGQKWYGCGSDRATAAPRPLDPSAPIPAGITLLCVEGDRRWDRIDPAARLDLPELFAPRDRRDSSPATAGPSRAIPKQPLPRERSAV